MEDSDSAKKLEAVAMNAPLTVTLGPMGSILRQLHSPELVRVDKKGVRRLREGLDGLCDSLKEASEADDPSSTAKLWMKEARDILYDTEDCVNEVVRPGIVGTPKRLPNTAKDLMVRVKDANGRHKRFLLRVKKEDAKGPKQLPVSAVPATAIPVNLDTGDLDFGSMDKLLPLLAFEDNHNIPQKQLKVVPIYGIAGIGKTTAATTLYREFSTKFQCRAFLRVSRNPDMRRLLTSLLSQIKGPPAKAFADVHDLINSINEHLKGKRFFVIIDDLWTTSVWYIIRRAFPDDKCCSRIVTTTQKEDVALACCSYQHDIFMMRPLNYKQSRELLFKRLNCSEGECPTHLKDHLDGIIRKCGGLPLAIVTIASLLASELANPENIQDLVSTIFRIISKELPVASASNIKVVSPGDFKEMELPVTFVSSEGIQEIIKLIYSKLPAHLKTCLLYLSMYPEDYAIKKDDLVKQWVAEGFLSAGEKTPWGVLEGTAGSYFDELVRTGMIQPVGLMDHDRSVLSYKVSHVVLDLIRCMSMEENFITVLDYFQTTPEELPYDKVRRLSIQSGNAKRPRIAFSWRTSQIRSLMFSGLLKCVPLFVDYRLLQVVILHVWAEEDSILDLTGIDTLFWLRYLKVQCNGTMVQLPDKIGGLKYLDTLEVPATMDSIPSDIGYLNKLLHLRLLIKGNLHHNIHWTSSLVSLGYFDISSNSTQNVEILGELKNLQYLHLTCSSVQPADKLEEKMKSLGWILGKLNNLKSVILGKSPGDAVGSSMSISCDGWSWDSAPANLERLELLPRVCIFTTLPNCLGGLLKLRNLKISVYKLSNEDINILKGLSALTAVSLYVRTELTEQIMFDKEGFVTLKYFKFMCIVPYMFFKQGAMSSVRKLKIGFNASRTQPKVLQSVRFKHLTCLEEIAAKIGGAGGNTSKAECAFLDAFREHTGSPTITVQRVDWVFDCDEEKSSVRVTQEQKLPGDLVLMEKTQEEEEQEIREEDVPFVEDDWGTTTGEKEQRTIEKHQDDEIKEDKTKSNVISQEQELQIEKDIKLRRRKKTQVWLQAEMEEKKDPLTDWLEEAKKAPLTASAGPMGSFLRQLHSGEVKGVTAETKQDIDRLCVSLMLLSEVEDPSFTAKLWMNEAREVLYDIQDCINEAVRPHEYFSELLLRVKDVSERRIISALHPDGLLKLPAMYVHNGDLDVGSRDKLLELMAFNNENEKKLKVVPVYGVAGVGKTTATAALYRKFSKIFQCGAYVQVSRNPDMARLLTDLLSQIKAPPSKALSDVHGLINTINEHLKGKRFFIIIDDLWTTSVWYVIRRAFPDDSCCSRIVITTQTEDVALACCSYNQAIFMMGPLHHSQSKLLFNRLYCCEGERPPLSQEDVDGIINICGGLPVAIITIASLLASEPNDEQRNHIKDTLSTILRINGRTSDRKKKLFSSTVNNCELVRPQHLKKISSEITAVASEGMKGIINLIYNKLPSHLKTCLLYLSMYPEDYTINKDDLVEQWLAEGFMSTGDETPRGKLEETAEGCFDELVRIGMIQAVGADCYSKVLSYKVGRVVLNLIRSRCMEENFVAVVDYFQTTSELLDDKVRRLSIQSGSAKRPQIASSWRTSQLRSVLFSGLLKCVPSVVDYRLLRVLILHIWAEEDNILDLTGINELFLLRYLKVKCNGIMVQLPDKIGGLKYLETLDVPATMDSIPSDIGYLNKLLHLRLVIKANLRYNIIHRTSSLVDISRNLTENMRKLSELMNLQDLHLTCSTVEPADKLQEKMKCLGWILGKLKNLKSVTLVLAGSSLIKGAGDVGGSSMSISCDGWSWVSPDSAPTNLKRLKLLPRVCIFPILPNWLGGLLQLCILNISVCKLSNKDIDILRGLPALTALTLSVRTGLAEWIRFDKEGFQVLKYFKFMCIVPYMVFKQGAMSSVRKLKIGFNASRTQPYVLQSVWFKHLTGLEEITAKIGGVGGNISKLESAFMGAIANHPGGPRIRVQHVDWIFNCEEEESRAEPQLAPVMQIDIQPVELLPSQKLFFYNTLELIIKGERGMIGICGPPGVGKTHFLGEINNSLQGDPLFDVVIFVSASRDCSVQSIQEQIIRRLNIVDDGDQISRAHKITNLLRVKSFLVLLDDFWEMLDPLVVFDEVGIPKPVGIQDQLVQRAVITARSSEAFKHLYTEVKQVPLLEEVDACKLFEETVGRRNLYSDPDIGALARDLVRELKGVASELILNGKEMHGKNEPTQWKDRIGVVRKNHEQLSATGVLVKDLENVTRDLHAGISGVRSVIEIGNRGGMRARNEVTRWLARADDIVIRAGKVTERHKMMYNVPAADMLREVLECSKDRPSPNDITIKAVPAPVQDRPDLEEALKLIRDDAVGMVGIWGMGGVGKTYLLKNINNSFLTVDATFFDVVILVTASREECPEGGVREKKGCSVGEIQDQILATQLDISEDAKSKKHIWANLIYNFLKGKSYLILIDDIWEDIDLRAVGIPYHDDTTAGATKQKVVFTTRSRDVCNKMGARKQMKISCLGEKEARELFEEQVSQETLSHIQIRDNVRQKVEQLGGLPLALITIGRAMHGKPTSIVDDNKEIVFQQLKYSYDGLKSKVLQECFLTCSLWPEDVEILKDDLARCWMGLGLVNEQDIQSSYNKAYMIMGELEAASLLENVTGISVEMHKVVRQMALWISCEYGENSKWVVRAGPQYRGTFQDAGLLQEMFTKYAPELLTKPSPADEALSRDFPWSDAERVSLMYNRMKELPPIDFNGILINLRILCLQHNLFDDKAFRIIEKFTMLAYLDLSWNKLEKIPEELCALVNLEYLNLSNNAGIGEMPRSFRNLIKLKFLYLGGTSIEIIPEGVISCMEALQVLDLWDPIALLTERPVVDFVWSVCPELEALNNLKEVDIVVAGDYQYELLSRYRLPLRNVNLQGMKWHSALFRPSKGIFADNLFRVSLRHLEITDSEMVEIAPSYPFQVLERLKLEYLYRLESIRLRRQDLFPRLFVLDVSFCDQLEHISCAIYLPCLKTLDVSFCRSITKAFSTGRKSPAAPTFPCLEELYFANLEGLVSVCESNVTFPSLKIMSFMDCPLLKRLPFKEETVPRDLQELVFEDIKYWEQLKWEEEGVQSLLEPHLKIQVAAISLLKQPPPSHADAESSSSHRRYAVPRRRRRPPSYY